ncbi:mitotic checkpoint serine/threonine-protein kinase BUB1 beta-like [Pollicipes pollicipes]|uniref:mitotic checkpoint serine/threonine-protein kinase BUB1 beta-like n=1 Tax=Pollicipes pollicipes TaxID=41117 RepID=UPI001884E07E|nr:mitotic checkpoint serine/threonine-protein kinase BUB1 beta-like [Pollicipes pollicipes]
MWAGQEGSDWELSKENVQPLRQGRRVAALNSSLQTAGDEQTAQKVAEQRRAFELEIRTYSGDDPLAPWYQYVLWMEQHCPRGGHEGNLDGLLEQCITKFHEERRYHQDPRYVSLWIRLACSSQKTQEIFQCMFQRSIGTSLTAFYTAWAAQYELGGNVRAADKVLAEGERCGAQPADALAEARRKLQTRVASALALYVNTVYEEAGAARGSPITANPGALAARAPPPPRADADWNPRVAVFEPPNDAVKAMYCKDVIYAGAGEVSFEELRAARWKKENKLLLEQRLVAEEIQRSFQEMARRNEEVLRRNEEVLLKNEQLERQLLELKARLPTAPQQGSLSSSAHLGSSNVSAGSSSLPGHNSHSLSSSAVAASPTVNTREAINCVREMLNRTAEAPAARARLQFDDELTGFVPLSDEVSFAVGDLEQFATAAGRVASTPMEHSRERFKSSSSSSGSDMSRQSRCDLSAPAAAQPWQQRPSDGARSCSQRSVVSRWSAPHLTQNSGYLADGSAEISAERPVTGARAAPPPADVGELEPPAEEPAAALSALTLDESPAHPDPWDERLIAALLSQLAVPVHQRQRYERLRGKLPNCALKEIEYGGRRLALTLIGEGAYARVYHALERDTGRALCLKVQPAGGEWEFYVVDEVHRRLASRAGAGQLEFVMPVERVSVFDNGSILSTEYEPAGSLLDVLNKLRHNPGKSIESLVMLLTAEMLGALEAVHAVGVIHGDVKPDNFLLRARALDRRQELLADLTRGGPPQLLQLIDFGRAIDTTLLPPGTTFTRVVTTDGFTCPEMLDGRPWTYQTDLYGAAASAYVLLFGSYLKLVRSAAEPARWTFTGTIRRYWCGSLWSEFFDTFLNIPSCATLPDLAAWRRRFLQQALASRELGECLSTLSLRLRER